MHCETNIHVHVADPKKLTIIIHVPRNLLIGFTMHCETNIHVHVADPKKLTIIIHVPRNLLIGFTMHCETKRPELKNNQSQHLLGFLL